MFLRSVRIDYLIEDRTEYYFLSEFFRFAGFWVVPCICGEARTWAKCESIIHVSGIKDPSAIDYRGIKSRSNNSVERLTMVAERMGYTGAEWYCLAKAYVAHSLMVHSKNISYSLSIDWLKNAAEAFRLAYEELESSEEIGMYLDYAKRYCQIKTDTALYCIDGRVLYPLADLKSDLEKLTVAYPDYINVQILSCLLYYSDIDVPEGEVNLCKYETMEETAMCLPELRYWIGNVYGSMEDDPFTEFYYTLSLDEKPDEDVFRSMINFLILREDYDQAVDYLEELIAFLEGRIQSKVATPKELDCYFWAHSELAEIYYSDLQNYWMAIQYGEYIRICCQELIDSSRFYSDFYGADAEYARNHTISSYDIATVQDVLKNIYQELGVWNEVG